jgi:ferredoxin
MTLFEEFIQVFDVWEEVRPYLHLMVDEEEMQLIVAMQGRAVVVQEATDLLGVDRAQAAGLLRRAYARHVVDKGKKEDAPTYVPGSLYHRLDHFAKHENWDDIPAEDRKRIDRRFLDEFIARHRANVEHKMQGREPDAAVPNDDVLLLHEVEEMVDAAQHIVVEPCDCRRLGQHCDRPVETCIWFDAAALSALDRGHGRRLTRDEALELIHWTDKKGLMHTGDAAWRAHGLSHLCNCCACDCYPFRAARELGSKGVWPRSRYVAAHDVARCNLCGACVQRCHFDAFYHDGTVVKIDGKAKENVVYDPDRCWGCGLCANTCPSDAIVMRDVMRET